jgi:hypothetical protein
MLQGSPQPVSLKWDRSLVTAFPSPATAALFRATIPGSMVPACYFAPSQQAALPVRPFCSATSTGSPRSRPLLRFWPVTAQLAASTCRCSRLRSPLGLLLPFGSKRSAGLAAGRSAFRIRPIPLRSPLPVLFQLRLRIIVPGSLRFRRLAVPQTSWNLIHYAPEAFWRQPLSLPINSFSTEFMWIVSNRLPGKQRDFLVDKTGGRRYVFAILEPKCEG